MMHQAVALLGACGSAAEEAAALARHRADVWVWLRAGGKEPQGWARFDASAVRDAYLRWVQDCHREFDKELRVESLDNDQPLVRARTCSPCLPALPCPLSFSFTRGHRSLGVHAAAAG